MPISGALFSYAEDTRVYAPVLRCLQAFETGHDLVATCVQPGQQRVLWFLSAPPCHCASKNLGKRQEQEIRIDAGAFVVLLVLMDAHSVLLSVTCLKTFFNKNDYDFQRRNT